MIIFEISLLSLNQYNVFRCLLSTLLNPERKLNYNIIFFQNKF